MSLKIKERMLIAALRDANVFVLRLDYSGGGDEGCINDVEALNYDYDLIQSKQITKCINELDEYLYSLLNENIYYDWVNNSGGNGTAELFLNDLTFKVDHYQNFQEYFKYEEIIDGPSIATL
jgi:hypothetical protein